MFGTQNEVRHDSKRVRWFTIYSATTSTFDVREANGSNNEMIIEIAQRYGWNRALAHQVCNREKWYQNLTRGEAKERLARWRQRATLAGCSTVVKWTD